MFLIAPFLLILFGFLSYYLGDKYGHKTRFPIAKFLAYFSFAVMCFTGVSLYLDNPVMDWVWRPFFPLAESGRDFMINSLIFSFPFNHASTVGIIDALATLLFVLYPLWLYLGIFIQKEWASA